MIEYVFTFLLSTSSLHQSLKHFETIWQQQHVSETLCFISFLNMLVVQMTNRVNETWDQDLVHRRMRRSKSSGPC